MNEFEQQLGSIVPAQGKSDPMQIMFLAGQQSTATQNGAGWWKLVSTTLAAACIVLSSCLFFEHWQNTTPTNIAKTESEKIDKAAPPLNAFVESQTFSSDRVEPTLQNPESWGPLGPRVRQLEAITSNQDLNEVETSGNSTSPFAFHRERNNPSSF